MTIETKTLLFNAAPLFAIALAYGALSVLIVPAIWRNRATATASDVAFATILPSLTVLAAVFGVIVAVAGDAGRRSSLGVVRRVPGRARAGRCSSSCASRVTALVSGEDRMRKAEARTTELDRELAAVTELSTALVRADSAETVGRTLIDEAAKLLGVEFGGLVVVGEELDRAVGVVARMQGHDVEWFGETDIDLRDETSGTASAVFGGLPLAVFDADASPLVHRRLVERTGAKSTAFIPLVAEGRVLAVLAVASTSARRMFTSDDLALLQALANEAALALDRLRSSAALADALERERVIGRIAAKFRTQLDLDSVMRVAVEETARTLGAQRAFIRLGDPADTAADRVRMAHARGRADRRERAAATGLEPRAEGAADGRGERHRSGHRDPRPRARLGRRAPRGRHPRGAGDADRGLRRDARRVLAPPIHGEQLDADRTSPSPRRSRGRRV